jgi:hypothetical protein
MGIGFGKNDAYQQGRAGLDRTYSVYFLCLEDVLHDLEIGDELVFVLCVHLDTIHWYVA